MIFWTFCGFLVFLGTRIFCFSSFPSSLICATTPLPCHDAQRMTAIPTRNARPYFDWGRSTRLAPNKPDIRSIRHAHRRSRWRLSATPAGSHHSWPIRSPFERACASVVVSRKQRYMSCGVWKHVSCCVFLFLHSPFPLCFYFHQFFFPFISVSLRYLERVSAGIWKIKKAMGMDGKKIWICRI